MDDSKKIKVINRQGNGVVSYKIPDMGNLYRVFQSGEEKILTFEEIRKLSYVPGGQKLLDQYLIIDDKEALKELNMSPEPEYYYSREDIINLMQNGSLDEFLDCLDFAPAGVKENIKILSVELPLNDVAKRKAILEKMNFNVDNAIRIKEESKEDNGFDGTVKPIKQRRTEIKTQQKPASSGRRVVISKDED